MQIADVQLLLDYSYAATGRILATAARLDPAEFVAVPPLRGAASLRDILVHMLDTERGWREDLRAGRRGTMPDLNPADFPDVAVLANAWREDEARMRAWLATHNDATLSGAAPNGRPLWVCLAHVANHSTQHRSEAAMILTHWGASPGDLDLTFYLRGWRDD